MFLKFLIRILLFACSLDLSLGNGRLIDPPMRSSLWRFGYDAPINYNDHTLNCGGYKRQHERNGGRCGVCGDPADGEPENEAPGKFARGIITRQYIAGSNVTMTIEMMAPRGGYFELRLCPVTDPSVPVTQECLDDHLLEILNGEGTRYPVEGELEEHHGLYDLTVRLPQGITCSQCVIQWKYHAGNELGYNTDGRLCLGCGPQLEMYNCADVSISPARGGRLVPRDREVAVVSIPKRPSTVERRTTPTVQQTASTEQTDIDTPAVEGDVPFSPTTADTDVTRQTNTPSFNQDDFRGPAVVTNSHPGKDSGDTYPSPTPYVNDDLPPSASAGENGDFGNNPTVDNEESRSAVPTQFPSTTPYGSSDVQSSNPPVPGNQGDGPTKTSMPYSGPAPTNAPAASTPELPNGVKIMIPDPFFEDLRTNGENTNQGTDPNDPVKTPATNTVETTTPELPDDVKIMIPDPLFEDLRRNPENFEKADTTPTEGATNGASTDKTVEWGNQDNWEDNSDKPQEVSGVVLDSSAFSHTSDEHDVSPVTDESKWPSWDDGERASWWSSSTSDKSSAGSSKKPKKSSTKSKKSHTSAGLGHEVGWMNQLFHLNRDRFIASQIWGGHGNMLGFGSLAGNTWGGNGGAWGVSLWPSSLWGVNVHSGNTWGTGAIAGNAWGGAGQWGGNSWGNSHSQNNWGSRNTFSGTGSWGWPGNGNNWASRSNSWNAQTANSWQTNQQRPLASHLPRCDSRQRLVCEGLGTFANNVQTKQYCDQNCPSGGQCPSNICSCRCAYQQGLACRYKTNGIALPSNHEWCNSLCNTGTCPVQYCECSSVVNW